MTVVTPAPFLEARALFGRAAGAKPLLAKCATLQVALAATYGLVIDDMLLAVLAFWPDGDRTEEWVFAGAPPAAFVPHITPLFRAARLILAARLHTQGLDRIVVRTSSAPDAFGHRAARLLGFVALPSEPARGFIGSTLVELELRRRMDFEA